MRFLLNKEKSLPFILFFLIVLTIPSFWRLLRPGIFSMHDFHIFRLFEFDQCVRDLQIPCRWAPDAAFGYGQPMFNFYGQLVYIIGEPFLLLGTQVIDTIKFLFIASLVFAAVSMFFLGRQLWGTNIAGLLSGMLYTFAPYRAIDVFVRGALPEAFAFVLFPLIIFFFNRYVLFVKKRDLLLFSLFLALLLLTHNLSFLMFLPFLGVWAAYFLIVHKKWFLIKNLILSLILSVGISAFYLLPVFFERELITLGKTLEGYYNFRAHFTTLNQLLISRVWGYGASLWGPVDDLSFSAGHVQWILSLVILGFTFLSRKVRQNHKFLILFGVSWFALFLTHGRSLFIWEAIPLLPYLQFPWRFLSIAAFSFALAGGALVLLIKNARLATFISALLIALVIALNLPFFKEDRWFSTNDKEQFSGELFIWHTSSAVNDFWPKYANTTPTAPAPPEPVFVAGEGEIIGFEKSSNRVVSKVRASENATIQFPVVYFDGWRGFIDLSPIEIYPRGDYGQITTKIRQGEHIITLRFTNTPVRTIGNFISLVVAGVFLWLIFKKNEHTT